MKLMILSAFCAVLIFAGVAEGRLGWTHEQCVQSFGEPVGQVETKLIKSEGKAEVFKTQIGDLPLFVRVEYQKGRVWMITYEGRAVRKQTAASLVAKIAGPKVKETTILRVQHWIENEKKIHAVYFTSPVQRLIVMNSKSLAAEKKPISTLILDAQKTTDEPEDAEAQKKPDPVDDPLEQF